VGGGIHMFRVFAVIMLIVTVQPAVCPVEYSVQGNSTGSHIQKDLKRLQDLKLRLRTVDENPPTVDKTHYKNEETVFIQVLAFNSGSQPVFLFYSRLLVQFLPELSRGSEVIAYSEQMRKRLADSKKTEAHWYDRNTLRIDSTISVKVPPNELTQASILTLSSYYPKLEPGLYSLRVIYHEPDGSEIVSESIMFEVASEVKSQILSGN
jgi:hypothetical protein